jgi:nucleotide-binding universal stress UspA family protein
MHHNSSFKKQHMKKIILVFDGNHFSEGAFKMATFINEIEEVMVTGVFLQPIDYRDIVGYSSMGDGSPITVAPYQTDESVTTKIIKTFESRCQHAGLEFRSHRDTDLFALQELQTETRFADLMILSSELFYDNIGAKQPNDYLKKVLHQSECPVLLVLETFKMPEKLILAYNGEEDSVYAIKQFTYLFPKLYQWETKLITVEEETEALPHQELIEELAAKHFANLTLEVVSTETKSSFASWISEQEGSILVAGAYGRNELSSLFKKSFLAEVIGEHKIPVFVAHK